MSNGTPNNTHYEPDPQIELPLDTGNQDDITVFSSNLSVSSSEVQHDQNTYATDDDACGPVMELALRESGETMNQDPDQDIDISDRLSSSPPISSMLIPSDARDRSEVPSDTSRSDAPSEASRSEVLSGDLMTLKLAVILPQEIPISVLQATDRLNKMLKNTVESKINLYIKDGKTKKFKLLDLTFPKSYAIKLKSDRSLIEAIIGDQICQKVESVEHLILPELAVDTVEYLLCEKKILANLTECRFLDVPFSASLSTVSQVELEQYLIQITEALVKKFATPTSSIIINFIPDQNSESLVDIKKTSAGSLKKRMKEKVASATAVIEVTCNSTMHTICKGEKQGNLRKRPRQADASTRPSAPKKSKTNHSNKKPFKPKPFPKTIAMFTFDSFPGSVSQESMISPLGSGSFTAYNYWQLEKVHGMNSKGKNTTIAIVDSGIDPSHPAFSNGQIIDFLDFSGSATYLDPSASMNHGTMCAGIACGNHFPYSIPASDEESMECNESFPAGVAPEAKLIVYKVLTAGATYSTMYSTILNALQAILKLHLSSEDDIHIDVVSLSLGSLHFKLEIAEAITNLVNNDIIVVCAASNNGYKYSQPISWPARLGNVLCIGSHGPHGKPSAFSPVGQEIDFLAPGENITGPSSIPYGNYLTADSGTSYATPAVTGLICLILGYIKESYKGNHEALKYFHNHWVMKEILRTISTSPGRHSDDQGFGALNPLQFFQHPEHTLNSIVSVLHANE